MRRPLSVLIWLAAAALQPAAAACAPAQGADADVAERPFGQGWSGPGAPGEGSGDDALLWHHNSQEMPEALPAGIVSGLPLSAGLAGLMTEESLAAGAAPRDWPGLDGMGAAPDAHRYPGPDVVEVIARPDSLAVERELRLPRRALQDFWHLGVAAEAPAVAAGSAPDPVDSLTLSFLAAAALISMFNTGRAARHRLRRARRRAWAQRISRPAPTMRAATLSHPLVRSGRRAGAARPGRRDHGSPFPLLEPLFGFLGTGMRARSPR